MAVGLVGATQPIPPCDRELWRLVRGERCAVALERVYREIPSARELRISIDGAFRWSQMFRSGSLKQTASDKRRALEERGWIAATD